MEKIPNLPFAQRVSVDSQEGNGHIWRQLQTAETFGRKRWSGIMLQRKGGRKRRLQRRKAARENLGPLPGNFRSDGRFWISSTRRSKASPKGNGC